MEGKIIAAEMRHSVEAVIALAIVLNKHTLSPQKQVSMRQVKHSDPPPANHFIILLIWVKEYRAIIQC